MAEQDLRDVAFPRLDEAQVARLARCAGASVKRYRSGEALFRTGERNFNFYAVRSGQVEIRDESGDAPKVITVHGPGEFTGEVGQLTGTPAVVTAVACGDTEVYELTTESLRQALNQCPDVGDIIVQAFIARRHLLQQPGSFTGVRVIGSRHSKATFCIREFLAKNRVPYTWLDLESHPEVRRLLDQLGVSEAETPVVAWGHKLILRNPSERQLAEALGLRQLLDQPTYDLVVVGAGPAGLAAAVYGASEGLTTVVLEREGPGGQASRSMRIENYLGFPTGVTGGELTERAVVQATRFGARLPAATPVTGLTFDSRYSVLHLDDGTTVTAKCLLIATGAEYRRLVAEGCERFEGCGVYYAATAVEAPVCQGADAAVVGGGNSAGQAAVYLSTIARKVYLVVRGDSLYKDMSAYLACRIERTENIEVRLRSVVKSMDGDEQLRTVVIENLETGERRAAEVAALFSFIGATPRTDWLPPEIDKDDKQFVQTGGAVARSPHWTVPRQPLLLETSHPGVFAAGDVRSGSIKRVASAVGEGATAIQLVHEYLKEL